MSYCRPRPCRGPLEQKTLRLSETLKCWNKDVADRTAARARSVKRYRSSSDIATRRAVADGDDRRSERFLSGGKFNVVDVRDSSLLGTL